MKNYKKEVKTAEKALFAVTVILLALIFQTSVIIAMPKRVSSSLSEVANLVSYNNTTFFTTINYHNTTVFIPKNSNESFENSALATDVDPPKIIDVYAMPPTQLVDNNVTIISRVIDDTAVDRVKVNITGPTGFMPVNITMTKSVEACYYYKNTYSIPGNYSYYIWANDPSNNSDCSLVYQFQIVNIPNNSLRGM